MVFGHKRRGLKGKLALPFYRASKPSVPATPPASLGFTVEDKFVLPSSKLIKASTLAKEGGGDLGDYVNGANDGDSMSEVDKRAASYISYVLERFKLEQVDDDWRKY
ncbi:hypothetical protein COCNU_02G014090 [Cocos nucifera]|uniref:Uncharacterized protein n=1 Tax=Cocos nucifera TaxID=13894 RepID=A0A8K0HZN5_COCNU|nr:hypothetical protein COCNU_02G014080 [Cocos nucifera]KAG1331441.1 hypothetical protein COCNU_02G014090 [Cocos nucifera]